VAARGNAQDVFRDELLSRVYGCDVRINVTPAQGIPFVLPHAFHSH
jgi:iron complex transport system ATP-binding protein